MKPNPFLQPFTRSKSYTLFNPLFCTDNPGHRYRRLLTKHRPNMRIFTLGDETVSPFRLNPFEFEPGSSLMRHLDNLRAIFNAAFPMYASMPYLLEEALVGIYMDKGWELATSTNRYFDVTRTADYSDYLPTLEELLHKIDQVVESKRYAQQLSQDLSAALRARLASLLSGSKGLMLNTKRSIPIKELLEHDTVLELKSLGDDDEKCFVMGLLLTRIYEYRETHFDGKGGLRHLTLFEEAHRLLKKVPEYASAEVANVRGKAVETFTNAISEIREYGEGFLIVDQIPNKMAPDVIKNTNFKLVHRTLARDDCNWVGSTMSLNEAQERELPLLRVGELIAHRENLDRAFRVKVPLLKDGSLETVSDQVVRDKMADFHQKYVGTFAKFLCHPYNAELNSVFHKFDFRKLDTDFYRAVIAIASVTVLDGESIEPVLNAARLIASRRFRAYEAIPHLFECHLIYSVNFLMQEINRRNSGFYDKVLAAQLALTSVCFGEDVVNNRKVFTQTIEDICQSSSLQPFLCWHIGESASARRLKHELKYDVNENYKVLDGFLEGETTSFLLATQVSTQNRNRIKREMLSLIVDGNTKRIKITHQYETFISEGRK